MTVLEPQTNLISEFVQHWFDTRRNVLLQQMKMSCGDGNDKLPRLCPWIPLCKTVKFTSLCLAEIAKALQPLATYFTCRDVLFYKHCFTV